MVNHEGKANRRFQRCVQAQSAVETRHRLLLKLPEEPRNDGVNRSDI
jgi:hypothetical protein